MILENKFDTTQQREFNRKSPIGRYEYVDVTFPPVPNTPMVIPTKLEMDRGSKWRFLDVNAQDRYVWDATAYTDAYPRDYTYASGNFAGQGGLTWTVDDADYTGAYSYVRNPYDPTVGLIHLQVQIATSSTGGTANTTLTFALPDGVKGSVYGAWRPAYVNENGTIRDNALIQLAAGDNLVSITKNDGSNWSNALTNTFYIYFTLTAQVYDIPRANWFLPRIYKSHLPSTLQSKPEYLVLSCDSPSYSTRLLVFEERNE